MQGENEASARAPRSSPASRSQTAGLPSGLSPQDSMDAGSLTLSSVPGSASDAIAGVATLGRACGGGTLRAYHCSLPTLHQLAATGSRAEVTLPVGLPQGQPWRPGERAPHAGQQVSKGLPTTRVRGSQCPRPEHRPLQPPLCHDHQPRRGQMESPGPLPLPQHPRIPEAWLSYLGDRAADPSKDGLHRAGLPPSPARVNLHFPLWVQPCSPPPDPVPASSVPTPHVGLLLLSWGHGRHWAEPQAPPASSPTPCGSLGQSCAQMGGAGPHGPRGPSSAFSLSCPFQWGQQAVMRRVPS